MAIGSLAHLALELDIDNIEDLRVESADSPDSHLATALELAERFRCDSAFANVRSAECEREVPFIIKIGVTTLHGIADLVGADFVLDYKTDSEMNPEEHRFQLWAYAKALGKSKAYIAYLRHGVLHEFDQMNTNDSNLAAERLIQGIKDGFYKASPAKEACGNCQYSEVCIDRFPH
ncbi:MAG: PD-(D/E)XK nuclease family protein [Acidobacteria bacterium]|nr:PD-(D/E)XK nuclease family protein [Acidobacteriota bacterium]